MQFQEILGHSEAVAMLRERLQLARVFGMKDLNTAAASALRQRAAGSASSRGTFRGQEGGGDAAPGCNKRKERHFLHP